MPRGDDRELDELLLAVRSGALTPEQAAERLRTHFATARGAEVLAPLAATIDHDRERRCGFPEVVLAEGKTPEQAAGIAARIAARSGRVLVTRAGSAHFAALRETLPEAVHHQEARCVVHDPEPLPRTGRVALVAAGTSDLRVAAEARVTMQTMGARVDSWLDVGVAGLHRLIARLPEIRAARVVVAVAGMEGALPSVLAGLVDVPVIAVPTSVGYGVGQGGLAALSTMLASCAAGVSVVNIDNGFGAGYSAALINRGGRHPGDGEG